MRLSTSDSSFIILSSKPIKDNKETNLSAPLSLLTYTAKGLLNIILKIFHKNGGNFLGKISFDWNSEIFKYFKVNCPVIAVSATNGKTMTNNCINSIIKTKSWILKQAVLKSH